MEAQETSPRGSLADNGISVPPATTIGASPTGGHSGSWEGFDSAFGALIEDSNMLKIPKDIDPQGRYKAPLALRAPPVPQVVIPQRVPSAIAARYEVEFRRLELARSLGDVYGGLLADSVTLVQEESDEVQVTAHINTLQQNISSHGMGVNTATYEPFIVPTPKSTDIPPTTPIVIPIPKLVIPTLESVGHQTRAVLGKVQADVEVIPVNLEHNSSELSSTTVDSSSSAGTSVESNYRSQA